MPDAPAGSVQRVDQWMWFARFVKSRTLAQALIERGKVRINREKIYKTSTIVRPGDVLTLSLGPRVLSIEVLGIGSRRGPASEAALLYRNLASPSPAPISGAEGETGTVEEGMDAPQAARSTGAGRPTKLERRQLDKLRGRS
ncbi:RNA-binding S4 domain-containing protein [Hyphomicrobium sp.]|uniref:RNA-binding S4 domain-containing protein n=1 Tax=Hyphomicrobium sp. TaxID=82 RepID=UPI002D7802B6|nr:RNA-binding S4 domain-containing protein [Hyphomicrobium sp.]HET6391120.1 RNA-binding S4 domain-containing protein [Hyphomicrobium sp.]